MLSNLTETSKNLQICMHAAPKLEKQKSGPKIRFPEGLENTPFKLKVLNYSRNCSLHDTLIPNLVKPLNCKYILF